MNVILATRKSPLALAQASLIAQRLNLAYPAVEVSFLGITTTGDRGQGSSYNNKGVFVKEVEEALLSGKAHAAVHSLKDLPAVLDERFALAAIGPKEDPRDAWVGKKWSGPEAAPPGTVIGTASPRRQALLSRFFPHLLTMPLRGNLGTRLARLEEGRVDALILARAGLARLGLGRLGQPLPENVFIPAPCQGVLAVEVLAGEEPFSSLFASLDDARARICATAERACAAALGVDCRTPFGAQAYFFRQRLFFRAFVAHPVGTPFLSIEMDGALEDPEALGRAAAEDFFRRGAKKILGERL